MTSSWSLIRYNMRLIIVTIFSAVLLQSCAGKATDPALKSAADFQQELKVFWEQDSTTPLHPEEKATFKGITFYPLSKDYIADARFTPIDSGAILAMPTSAKKTKYFKEYGKLDFTLRDTPVSLIVYQPDPPHATDPEGLFLPFTDKTSGNSSYGAGRYIDLSVKDIRKGRLIVDFNKAYNPYCAYSAHYNCPIPPATNRLQVSVAAGVSYTQGQH